MEILTVSTTVLLLVTFGLHLMAVAATDQQRWESSDRYTTLRNFTFILAGVFSVAATVLALAVALFRQGSA